MHLCKTGKQGLLLRKGTWNLVRRCGLQHKQMAFFLLLLDVARAGKLGRTTV